MLIHANNLFYKDASEHGIFVTAWVGVLDLSSLNMTYSSAGHYPALLKRRNGAILKLTTKGIALGVTLLEEAEEESLQLEEGDLLLLYTDGVIESLSKEGKAFGVKRLEEFLAMQDEKPVRYIVKELSKDLEQFSEGREQHDDLTFLIIRIK